MHVYRYNTNHDTVKICIIHSKLLYVSSVHLQKYIQTNYTVEP